MKKLLGILVLGLLWCNVGVAGDYKNLLAKAKVATKEQIHEIIALAKKTKINSVANQKSGIAIPKPERNFAR